MRAQSCSFCFIIFNFWDTLYVLVPWIWECHCCRTTGSSWRYWHQKWCWSISQRSPRGSIGQEQSRPRDHSSPFLFHKLPNSYYFGSPFWRTKPDHDWTCPTLLDSLPCLLLQGQEYFGLCLMHFSREEQIAPYRRFGPNLSGFVFGPVSFIFNWLRGDFLIWIAY